MPYAFRCPLTRLRDLKDHEMRRAVLIGTLAAAAIAVVIGFNLKPEPLVAAIPAPLPLPASPPGATAAAPQARAPQVAHLRAESVGDRYRFLVAQGKPGDLLDAYQLALQCHYTRTAPASDDPRLRPVLEGALDREGTCAGMPPLTDQQRIALVETAMKAGLHGASTLYFNEGPQGDIAAVQARPNDPDVAEWKQRALAYMERDAKRGDPAAMQTLADLFSDGTVYGPDHAKSLMYRTARYELLMAKGGTLPPQVVAGYELAKRRAPANEVQAAIQAGKELARAARGQS